MAERRPAGLSRRPDFGTAEDRLLGIAPPEPDPTAPQVIRGASGASPMAEIQPPVHRRPLKVADAIADQLHDAVLFLRGRGRPELTQNELIDELLDDGLKRMKEDVNEGKSFPISARRGRARTP